VPSRPPSLKQKPRAKSWATTRKSRQQRGYGRAHELMRAQVLKEEPLCRPCLDAGRVTPSTIADHKIPKAEGGTDDRENYQGICDPCHQVKTAEEASRARARSRTPGGRSKIGRSYP